MQFFSYQPRSGSRVLASRVAPAVVVAYPGCGTIVCGDLVQLSYGTAYPGHYWRTEARRMAQQIVLRVGGLAEDEQGCVSLVVPRQWGWRAHELMTTAGEWRRQEDDGDAAITRLVQEGCTNLSDDLKIVQEAVLPPFNEEGWAWYRPNGTLVAHDGECPEGAVTGVLGVEVVELPPRRTPEAGDPPIRYGVRVGIYDPHNGTWLRVYGDLSRMGKPIQVEVPMTAAVIGNHLMDRDYGHRANPYGPGSILVTPSVPRTETAPPEPSSEEPEACWFYVVVNENMHDARAWISSSDEGLSGWERVWSAHSTREAAEVALAEAKEHAQGRQLA